MGYELHITRAEDWVESLDDPIAEQEWRDYADNAAQLSVNGSIGLGGTAESPVYALEADGSAPLALWWCDGRIEVAGVAGESAVPAVLAVARHLRATVQGDDGETYD